MLTYSVLGKSDDKKHNFTLKLCNNDIKQVSCSKYLGVYVDDQLNWKNHIEYVHKNF